MAKEPIYLVKERIENQLLLLKQQFLNDVLTIKQYHELIRNLLQSFCDS